MPQPALLGLRLLDLTHMLSGPYCAMLLADLGMEVLKVEPPGGEPTRRLLADHDVWSRRGFGAYHLALNRNKDSVQCDLKSEAGRRAFLEEVTRSDVVLCNFGPGVTERLGIDHATLAAVNPRIVTCDISGYGQTGPESDKVAFDMIAQAASGAMSLTGRPGDPPLRAGIPMGDLGAGLMATIGILTALIQRGTTGRGQHVDISMMDVQLSLSSYLGAMALLGQGPPRMGNAHPAHVPYDTYPASDGHIVVAVVFPAFWPRLCAAIDAPDLDTVDYATPEGRVAHRDAIDARLRAIFATRTRAHWTEVLGRARIPCAPVRTLDEALASDQARARQMVVDVRDAQRQVHVVGNPIKLSDHEQQWRMAPELGPHLAPRQEREGSED